MNGQQPFALVESGKSPDHPCLYSDPMDEGPDMDLSWLIVPLPEESGKPNYEKRAQEEFERRMAIVKAQYHMEQQEIETAKQTALTAARQQVASVRDTAIDPTANVDDDDGGLGGYGAAAATVSMLEPEHLS